MRRGHGWGAKTRGGGGGSRGALRAASGVPAARAPAPGSGAAEPGDLGPSHRSWRLRTPAGSWGRGWRAQGSGRALTREAGAGWSPAPRCLSRRWDRLGSAPAPRVGRWPAENARWGLPAPNLKARCSGSAMFTPGEGEAPKLFRKVSVRSGGCDLQVEICRIITGEFRNENKTNNKTQRISGPRSQKFGF